MFIEIKKGNKTKKVSMSMFHNYYENAGWKVSSNSEIEANEAEDAAVDETNEVDNDEANSEDEWDELEDEEDFEKPISEMNNAELKQYAAEHNIDISGLNSNKQIREAIKAAM